MNNGKSDTNSDNSPDLTHVDGAGRASMVGVGHKIQTRRIARATGAILLGPEAFRRVAENSLKKGPQVLIKNVNGKVVITPVAETQPAGKKVRFDIRGCLTEI